tara:strand:+ start:75795 stop:75986 length:192 start_codon:yes stop_codon:yes gene_type:complete
MKRSAVMAVTGMKNETQKETKKTIRVALFIALAVASVGLSACNTVRGVAKDVTDAANALDPSE